MSCHLNSLVDASILHEPFMQKIDDVLHSPEYEMKSNSEIADELTEIVFNLLEKTQREPEVEAS